MKATWSCFALQFFPETKEEHQAMLSIIDGLKKIPGLYAEGCVFGRGIWPYLGDNEFVGSDHESRVVEETAQTHGG